MSLFERFCHEYLGPAASPDDPVHQQDETVRRVRALVDRYPLEVRKGEAHVTFLLWPPSAGPVWSEEGLSASVQLGSFDADGSVIWISEANCILATKEALAADDWDERLAAFDAKRAEMAERFDALSVFDGCLEPPVPPAPPEDDGWEAYAAELGLNRDKLDARLAPLADAAFATFARARERYRRIYDLPLPSGLLQLAVLFSALGELSAGPEDHYYEAEPGWGRGGAWMDAALGMRSAGILDWFAPGGLDRKTRDAAQMHEQVPPGGEGPLDPRLDMRYRRDAPQFVTFLSGDSDGLHWGLWYDSPAWFPVVAHNYARDSSETWLDAPCEVIPFLRAKLIEEIDRAVQEYSEYDEDDENRPYARRRWRALRVISAHLDAIERWAEQHTWEPEPLCPWPRTEGHPAGNPRLALRPDAGTVPRTVPGFSDSYHTPPVEQRRTWMEEARRELEAGKPAHAHALGLYLHWLDADDVRDEAAKLLGDAYEALGFQPFAEILRVHVLHRDLPSVGVFDGS